MHVSPSFKSRRFHSTKAGALILSPLERRFRRELPLLRVHGFCVVVSVSSCGTRPCPTREGSAPAKRESESGNGNQSLEKKIRLWERKSESRKENQILEKEIRFWKRKSESGRRKSESGFVFACVCVSEREPERERERQRERDRERERGTHLDGGQEILHGRLPLRNGRQVVDHQHLQSGGVAKHGENAALPPSG